MFNSVVYATLVIYIRYHLRRASCTGNKLPVTIKKLPNHQYALAAKLDRIVCMNFTEDDDIPLQCV